MKINITYDASASGAPAGLAQAVNAAVQYFDATISTQINVNIDVGWGEVGGQAIGSGAVGASLSAVIPTPYAGVVGDLRDQVSAPGVVGAILGLPITDPSGSALLDVNLADARALGIYRSSGGGVDGYVGLNSTDSFTFDPNNRAVAGDYDAIGVIEHEISEVLGRDGLLGQVQPDGSTPYSVLDLFRYSGPGVHDMSPGPGYFSLNGQTMLLPFNDPSNGGDAGDWASSVTGDAFGAFAQTGVEEQVSSVDLRVLQVLGYDISATAPTPNGVAVKPLTLTGDDNLAQGQTLSFNGQFAIVMQLPSGSGTPVLTNAGTITDSGLDSQVDVVGLSQTGSNGFSPSSFTNATSGVFEISALAQASDAIGVAAGLWPIDIINSGLIQVSAATGDAWGVQGEGEGVAFSNTSTGSLTVQASGYAYGVTFADGGTFSNAGVVSVTGQDATAFSGVTSFSNTGTITATDRVPGSGSTAVFLQDYGQSPPPSFVNSGTIQGDYAIRIEASEALPGAYPSITLDNSGHIIGEVDLAYVAADIVNTGSIAGAIHFGDGANVYQGASGTEAGGIYLGQGSDTVTLGNDGEAVYGGGGSDAITGGSGDDYFEIYRGSSTIDGGGGINTLSFADADIGVTVNLATGSASAAGGVDTFKNIQRVVGSGFDDSLTAGSAGAELIGGGGRDTLVGGAGNDTLVASAGGALATGGGGNNTFVYSAGDHQLVITDFKAGGDKDVLQIYGYAAAESVSQQGADTLVTLSGGDTVLLKGVTASSLSGGDIVYSSSPFVGPSLPPSAPVFGTTAINMDADLKIVAGETLDITNQPVAIDDQGYLSPSGHYHTLDNFGSITAATSSGDIAGFETDLSSSSGAFINEAGASYAVVDTDPNGAAMGLNDGYSPSVTNSGSFTVTAVGDAYGDYTSDSDVPYANTGSGRLTVTSSAKDAYGFYLYTGGHLSNDGSINVSAAGTAYGVWLNQALDSSVANTGSVVASSSSSGGVSYGVYVATGAEVSITNSGLIKGTYGIYADSELNLHNTGVIAGGVFTSGGDDQVVNSGSIVGDVQFGDGDSVYNGAGGTLSGGIITLGRGTNTVTLGNDGETVIGGNVADSITGGSGDDFIEIGRGLNTIDGGGGINTLSFADADMQVTVNLAAGAAFASGADTIRNIQRVIGGAFDDDMTAGAAAAEFFAGSGHDTLTGGAGDDTLVGGAGGDLMTGGGGSNSFIYSAGDHQVVITDFQAAGSHDVLDIYGYSAPLSVQQQGADALVTLSSTDSVLLKGVTATTLTAGQIHYSLGTYPGEPVVPPTPPILGASYISLDHNLTVYAGETLNVTPNGVVGSGLSTAIWMGSVDIDNSGTIDVQTSSSGIIDGIYFSYGFNGANYITNEAGGRIDITNTAGVAAGISGIENPPILNYGDLSVEGGASAFGVRLFEPNQPVTNEAGGVWSVSASAGTAYGVETELSGAPVITNDGTMTVSGDGLAYGVDVTNFFSVDFVNDGVLTVTAKGHGAETYGLNVVGPYNTDTSNAIDNAGTITAAYAIFDAGTSQGYAPLAVANSGILNGQVDLGGSDSQLNNSGTINGDVTFATVDPSHINSLLWGVPSITNSGSINGAITTGDEADHVVNGGTVTGPVTLAGGNDLYDGSKGVQEGVVYGGAGDDTLLGGAGDDTLSGGSGDDSIDGGGGFNTVLMDGPEANYTVTSLGGGAYTIRDNVGSDGLDHISNIALIEFTDGSMSLLSGPNVFTGTNGPDLLDGSAGSDAMFGLAGDDTLIGLAGDDTLYGGAGDDTLDGGPGNDSLDGGMGVNTASYADATSGVTVSLLLAGSPQNTGGAGTDTLVNIQSLIGSPFNDHLIGDADNNTLDGGAGGDDTLDGGGGINTASFAHASAHVTVNLGVEGSAQNTNVGHDVLISIQDVIGSDFDDILYAANAGGNGLYGGAGDDTIYASAGGDTIDGGSGTNWADFYLGGIASGVTVNLNLQGSAQNTGGAGQELLNNIQNIQGSSYDDVLTGDAHNNNLQGRAGDDTLDGGPGDDTLNGGPGINTASYADAPGGVSVSLLLEGAPQNTGSAGNDTLVSIQNLIGSPFNDVLTGDANANVIQGGAGDDTITGGGGDDTIDGGSGVNTFVLSGPQANYTVTPLGGSAYAVKDNVGTDGLDHIVNIQTLQFADGSLSLNANETLTGTAGADTLTGSPGDDLIYGLAGNDVLYGGAGDDTLDGGPGADTLDGGAGVNTASYADATAAVSVSLAITGAQNTKGAGTDTLVNIENLTGSAFNDVLKGDAGNNVLDGGAGDDTLIGGGGADTATYADAASGVTVSLAVSGPQNTSGAGTDSLSGISNLTGSAFNDVLTGSAKANLLLGGAGDDTLIGGKGADTLTGGPGADHFVYKATTDSTVAVSGQDVITDFSHAQGDRIDVSAISPSFTLVAAFTHAADQLIEVAKPGGYLVEGDVNGDGKPDFAIMVDTSTPLVTSDFIL